MKVTYLNNGKELSEKSMDTVPRKGDYVEIAGKEYMVKKVKFIDSGGAQINVETAQESIYS